MFTERNSSIAAFLIGSRSASKGEVTRTEAVGRAKNLAIQALLGDANLERVASNLARLDKTPTFAQLMHWRTSNITYFRVDAFVFPITELFALHNLHEAVISTIEADVSTTGDTRSPRLVPFLHIDYNPEVAHEVVFNYGVVWNPADYDRYQRSAIDSIEMLKKAYATATRLPDGGYNLGDIRRSLQKSLGLEHLEAENKELIQKGQLHLGKHHAPRRGGGGGRGRGNFHQGPRITPRGGAARGAAQGGGARRTEYSAPTSDEAPPYTEDEAPEESEVPAPPAAHSYAGRVSTLAPPPKASASPPKAPASITIPTPAPSTSAPQ